MTEKPLVEVPGPQPKFYQTKQFYYAIGLLAVLLVPTIVYYGMSYNSVNGTTVQLISGSRSTLFGNYAYIFYVEIHVWSYATSIDTHLSNPTFGLVVDSYPFATAQALGGTWQTGGYISYNLKFQTSDFSVAQAVGRTNTNFLTVSMDGVVSAGWFSEDITRSNSATWTFSG